MSDLIDRQAAIDALGERPMVWVGSDYELGARNQYDADVLALETVPSAQPVRHGKWLPKHHYIAGYEFVSGHICSECGNDALNAEGDDFLTDYCPNCGAKMDGEIEG